MQRHAYEACLEAEVIAVLYITALLQAVGEELEL